MFGLFDFVAVGVDEFVNVTVHWLRPSEKYKGPCYGPLGMRTI